MFTGIRKIPWRQLRHAYGDASDIPTVLRRVLSDDAGTRQRAIRYLHHSLVHQGLDRGPATMYATDFVVRMIGHSRVRDKDRLIKLLTYFAVGEPANSFYFINGFDLDVNYGPGGSIEYGFFRVDDPDYGPTMRAIYARVLHGLPSYLALLSSRSVRVRTAVPGLLGWLAPAADTIVPALLDRLAIERVERVRESLLIAISLLRVDALPKQRKPTFAYAVATLRQSRPPLLAYLLRVLSKPLPYRYTPWSQLNEHVTLFRLVLHYAPHLHARVLWAARRVLRRCEEGTARDLSVFVANELRSEAEARAFERFIKSCRSAKALAIYGNLSNMLHERRKTWS